MPTFKINPKWLSLFQTIKQLKSQGIETSQLEAQLKNIPQKLRDGITLGELINPPQDDDEEEQPRQKKQPKQKSSDLTLLGKKYPIGKGKQYKTINELAKKENLPLSILKDIRNGKVERVIKNKQGETQTIDITKPLILRKIKQDLNISNLTTKMLITGKDGGQGTKVKMYIWCKFEAQVSIEIIQRQIGRIFDVDIGQNMLDFITKIIEYEYPYGNLNIKIKELIIKRNNSNGQILQLQDMILREEAPINISNIWGNVEINEGGNCIFDYLKSKFKREYSDKTLQELHNTNDIYNFCMSKSIKMIAYDIEGNVIMSYYPEINTRHKSLIFIAYNNHLYPVKS